MCLRRVLGPTPFLPLTLPPPPCFEGVRGSNGIGPYCVFITVDSFIRAIRYDDELKEPPPLPVTPVRRLWHPIHYHSTSPTPLTQDSITKSWTDQWHTTIASRCVPKHMILPWFLRPINEPLHLWRRTMRPNRKAPARLHSYFHFSAANCDVWNPVRAEGLVRDTLETLVDAKNARRSMGIL